MNDGHDGTPTVPPPPHHQQQQQANSTSTATSSGSTTWRKSVAQSFRNNQVEQVAKVLASLEPGTATSTRSKLMLAMRFEQLIFEKADTMEDYLKKIQQRLKRLKKNYKPEEQTNNNNNNNNNTKDEQLELELRRNYGAKLQFILQNSEKAIEAMKEKHGEERASLLQQHLDNAEQWAVDIGVIPEEEEEEKDEGTPKKKKKRKRVTTTTKEISYLQTLKDMLAEKRVVENIRSHVLKLVDPDLFLLESLEKLEDETTLEENPLLRLREKLALVVSSQKRWMAEGMSYYPSDMETTRAMLDTLSVPVPPPRQGQTQDIQESSLAYVERIGICSQLLIAYMMALPQQPSNERAQLKGALPKIQKYAMDGMEHLGTYYVPKTLLGKEKTILLQDAWTKRMEFHPTTTTTVVSTTMEQQEDNTCTEKQKVSSMTFVGLPFKSKVLLTPGRKIPSNFLLALESKNAKLIRPSCSNQGAQLLLCFGNAFTLTIFFQPLTVLIRARSSSSSSESDNTNNPHDSDFKTNVIYGGFPIWTSTGFGVEAKSNASVFVAQKLEFASARATNILRHVFADIVGKTYETAKTEFEIEISVSSPLLICLGNTLCSSCFM